MDEMYTATTESETCKIGEALFRNVPLLSLYSEYTANSQGALDFFQRDADIISFIESATMTMPPNKKKTFIELTDLPRCRLAKYQGTIITYICNQVVGVLNHMLITPK